MLQIASRMYFPDGAELYETTHRNVLYTNAGATTSAVISLPFARFLISTGATPINTVTVEVEDRLEVVDRDGSESFHIATNGTEHIDEAADLFAFVFNLTCTRNAALAQGLIPHEVKRGPTRSASGILRRTCDPMVIPSEDEIADASDFADTLLALERHHYERAMRAIRTVVNASLLVYAEPGLASMLYVAALESLAQKAIPAAAKFDWNRYPGDKRKLFETAIAEAALTDEQANLIRDAAMRSDQLSLKRRFSEFTLDHIDPRFYREGASGATRPIKAVDLPHALSIAYDQRSRNVHTLERLAPELWAISDRSDTMSFGGRTVLGLEGLNRLARHVIQNFVARAPAGVVDDFDYRSALPGIVRVELAPQYWLGRVAGFSVKAAPRFLNALCEILLEPAPEVPDMTRVLERIEHLLKETSDSEARAPMVAIYVLCHLHLPSHRRVNAEDVIEAFQSDLKNPNAAGLAAEILGTGRFSWSPQALVAAAEQRQGRLQKGREPLPPRIDAALLIHTSTTIWEDDLECALNLLSDAVELLPGNDALIGYEKAARAGVAPPELAVREVLRPTGALTETELDRSGETSLADVEEDVRSD